MIQLPPDFKEFLRLLNATRIEYLVVGGYAVGAHGYVRTTGDLDIWIGPGAANVRGLEDVLLQFGFSKESLPQGFGTEIRIIRIGIPPLRIELLSSVSGLSFEEAYSNMMESVIEEIPVKIIGLEDLAKNKKAAGRLKDLADLENLGL